MVNSPTEQVASDLYSKARGGDAPSIEAAIIDLERTIASSLNITDVYDQFASKLKQLIDFDRASVHIVDLQSYTHIVKYHYGDGLRQRPAGTRRPLTGTTIEKVIQTGKTTLLPDLRQGSDFAVQTELVKLGLLSLIRVPLPFQGRIIGTLGLNSRQAGRYGLSEQAILERLGMLIAPAISHAELHQQLQAHIAERDVLDHIASILTSTLEIEQVYHQFAQEVRKLLPFDRIAINIVEEEKGVFIPAHQSGIYNEARPIGVPQPISGAIIEQILKTRQTLIRRDITQDRQYSGDEARVALGIRAIMMVPLINLGRFVGVITLQSVQPGAFGQEQRRILELLAAQIAPAVENSFLYRRVSQSEAQLRLHAQELSRSNAELEQFAYVASHDLQEPLRMVSSYTQLLARRYKGKLDSDADEFIAFAVDGAIRMQSLINDLLDYSRVGRRGKPFAPVDTNQVVVRVLHGLGNAIRDAGAEVTFAPLPEVSADAGQLAQVFQNLISNAIKFRGEQPAKVSIEAAVERDEIVFQVRDNGIGIAPEYHSAIFQVFQRLHTLREYTGNGIGLAICKKVVERHGGHIWVESSPGAGATFYFTIPTKG